MQKLSKETIYQVLGFALIALATVIAYAPSLLHCPRADQITYFAEVGNRESWVDLAVHTYNLNRQRQFCPGDELLFRPVVYFLLGTEKFLFHYNFIFWQAVGIALHLGVVWCLLRLLLTIHVSLAAVFTTAFMALAYINMEMVTWQHINAYMIFVICFLVALRQWWLMVFKHEKGIKPVIYFFIASLIGCFTYEVMNVHAVLMVLSMLTVRQDLRRHAGILVLPIVLYMIASVGDILLVKAASWEATRMINRAWDLPTTFYNIGWSICFWIFTTIFAVQLPIDLIARNVINAQAQPILFLIQWQHPATVAAFFLMLWVIWVWLRQSLKDWSKHALLLFLLTGMLVVYAMIIVVGRANSRGMWDILRVDLYYQYLVVLLLLIFIYASINWQALKSKVVKVVGVIILLMMVFTNAYQLYLVNMRQAEANLAIESLVNTLEALIIEKGHESDFSFYVDPNYPGNYIYEEIKNVQNPTKQYSLIEALYPKYFRPKGLAKYSFLAKS